MALARAQLTHVNPGYVATPTLEYRQIWAGHVDKTPAQRAVRPVQAGESGPMSGNVALPPVLVGPGGLLLQPSTFDGRGEACEVTAAVVRSPLSGGVGVNSRPRYP